MGRGNKSKTRTASPTRDFVLARVRGSRDGVWVVVDHQDQDRHVRREDLQPGLHIEQELSKKEVRALGYFIQKNAPPSECECDCRCSHFNNLTDCHKCGNVHRYDAHAPCWSKLHGPVYRGGRRENN